MKFLVGAKMDGFGALFPIIRVRTVISFYYVSISLDFYILTSLAVVCLGVSDVDSMRGP